MIASSRRAPIRLRATWAVRLIAIELRRNRRATLIGVCAFAVTTLAVVACLALWVPAWHAGAGAGDQSEAPARGTELVAFLREELPAPSRDALAATLGRLPGVAAVRLLGSEEALAWMRRQLGDHSAILEGVEEGFLPATLEISLRAGPEGVGRADAIAWRLRRMDGITDVDVLRTTIPVPSPPPGASAPPAWRAGIYGRGLGQIGLALGSATALLGVGLAAVALRRRRADAHLLVGLGFTTRAIAVPAAIAGAVCALAGTMLAAFLVAGAAYLGQVPAIWQGAPAVAHLGGDTWWPSAGARVGGVFAVVVAVGAGLGWWGARPGVHEVEDLAPTD